MIEEFEARTANGDSKAGVSLHKIRFYHPLFSKIGLNSFKYIIENSYIFKLKPG